MRIVEELADSRNLIVSLADKKDTKKDILKAIKSLSPQYQLVCYVSTSPSDEIAASLKKNGIDTKQYCFVDCSGENTEGKAASGKYLPVLSPKDTEGLVSTLSEIIGHKGIPLSNVLGGKEVQLLVFDSVSSFIEHNSELAVVQFLNFLMSKIKQSRTKAIYFVMKTDLGKSLVKEIELLADRVIDVE